MEMTIPNQDNYKVLAIRARPRRLDQLVGQTSIVQALSHALERQQIPHAMLFTGVRGTGKTSTARILAKSLCCEKGVTTQPCLSCQHCQYIESSSHEDVLEIDAASNTGVDNIRELRDLSQFYPSRARFRIFIIDEAHMLSSGAFNALLKTLEEPPPNVLFILATTELHKIPLTVRSRCVTFYFKKVQSSILNSFLIQLARCQGKELSIEGADEISRLGAGSIRDSLSILEHAIAVAPDSKIEEKDILIIGGGDLGNLAEEFVYAIDKNDAITCLEVLQKIDESELDWSRFSKFIMDLLKSRILDKKDHDLQGFWLEAFRVFAKLSLDLPKVQNPLNWFEVAACDVLSRRDWFAPSSMQDHLQKKGLTSASSTHTHGGNPTQELKATSNPKVQIRNDEDLFHLFEKAVRIVGEKSLPLASRLKHATLLNISVSAIEFDSTPGNQLYCRCTPAELLIFREALRQVGLGQAELVGFAVDGDNQAQSQKKNPRLQKLKDTETKGSNVQVRSIAAAEQVHVDLVETEFREKVKNDYPALDILNKMGSRVYAVPKGGKPILI